MSPAGRPAHARSSYRRAAVVVLAGLTVLALAGFSAPRYPDPDGLVVDTAGALPDEVERRVEDRLTAYAEQTQNGIAVAVVGDMGGQSIEDYAEDLFDRWGVGTKEKDSGALLVIAMAERKVRIEVGYGLEG